MAIIIPDKIVDLLSSMFEDVRDKQFIIGDTLIEIVNATGDKGGTIAYLAGRLGVSASTLYDYYRRRFGKLEDDDEEIPF